MEIAKYEALVKKIDNKLEHGSFNFRYKSTTQEQERNAFTGLKTSNSTKWENAIAIKREEQMIVDSNNIHHSIIGDEIEL